MVSHNMDTDEDLKLASKTWNRVIENVKKAGYREGIEEGSQSVYQDGFDKGYEEGINIAFILGQYKALMINITDNIEYPDEVKRILSETRYGSCYICQNDLINKQDTKESHISDIIDCQRSHSQKIIDTLYNFFSPLMKERNINIDHLKL